MSNPIDEVELSPVILFRMELLIRAGYSPDNAELLASRDEIDWHRVVDILPLARAKGIEEEVIVGIFV